MAGSDIGVTSLNTGLPDGWEARVTSAGRIFYINHHTQTSHWVPPSDHWDASNGLPYGWEEATDKGGKPYYINHVTRITTIDDPRDEGENVETPQPREVELTRDPQLGFGFVAGSEKPVIVRFVTESGPSEEKLLPGDQICEINGEDVKKAPREYVIDLIRSCKESINLTVCQPFADNSNRKSAILTAAKKAKLKSNPSRVRFAESVTVNGDKILTHPSNNESYVPFMPNVLKVFLENGQTKSFKYDSKTTVKDVLYSLQEKLSIVCIEHFALVLQDMRSPSHGKMNILKEDETLSEIASRPGAQHFKCLFRVAFVPKDAYDLVNKDTTGFEYFYRQCCNDVVHERFASELKYDVALRLAALHIQQHALSKNITGKLSIKSIEKDCGLDKFVSHSLIESMKGKDLRKMIGHYVKMNHNLAPGQKQLTELQAKLHYMKIVGELRSFGGRCFMVTLVERKTEAMVLVGPKCGISVVTSIKTNALALIAQFEDIDSIVISKESDSMQQVQITLDESQNQRQTTLLMMNTDIQDFMALVEGYYKLFADKNRNIFVVVPGSFDSMQKEHIPPYHAKHNVIPDKWSYVTDDDAHIVNPDAEENGVGKENDRLIDLSKGPPDYHDNLDYISKIKEELGIKGEQFKLGISTRSVHLEVTDAITCGVGIVTTGVLNANSPPCDQNKDNLANEIMAAVNNYDNAQKHRTIVAQEINNSEKTDSNTDNDSMSSSSTLHRLQNEARSIESDVRTDFTDVNGFNYKDNHKEYKNHLDSRDDISDTESETASELMDGESDPLLQPDKETYMYRLDAKDLTSVPGYLHSESDDTDSYSTPTDSPSKKRLESLNLAPTSLNPLHADLQRPHSFGLHSPDQLPRTERDFKKIAASFGLHSPDQLDQLDDTFKKKVISEGGLYVEADLIDLTLIPPPKTPDQERLIDFTEAASIPPPGFTDEEEATKEEVLVATSMGEVAAAREPEKEPGDSETDSGNETISSENIELSGTINDFLSGQSEVSLSLQPKPQPETDIDALIAKLTVPPPPKDISLITLEDVSPEERSFETSSTVVSNSLDMEVLEVGDMRSLDDEIASLVIPPPPSSSDEVTGGVDNALTMSSSSSGAGSPLNTVFVVTSVPGSASRSSSGGPGSPVSKSVVREPFIRQASSESDSTARSPVKKTVEDYKKLFSKEDARTFSHSDHELKRDIDKNLVKAHSDTSLLQEIESDIGRSLTDRPPPPLRTSSVASGLDNEKKVVIVNKPVPDKEVVIIDKTGPMSYADNWVQQVQSSREAASETLPYKHGSGSGGSAVTRRASLRDERAHPIIVDSKRPSSLDRVVQKRSDGLPPKLTFIQRSSSFQTGGKHRTLMSQQVMPTSGKLDLAKYTCDKTNQDSTKDTSETEIPKPLKSILIKRTDSMSSVNSDPEKPIPKPRVKRSASLNSPKRRSSFPLSVLPQGCSDAEKVLLRAQSSDKITSQPLKSSFGQRISRHSPSSDALTVTPPTSLTQNQPKDQPGHKRSSSLDVQRSLSPPAVRDGHTASPRGSLGSVPQIRNALKPVGSSASSQPRDSMKKPGPMRVIRHSLTPSESDSISENNRDVSTTDSRSSSRMSQSTSSAVSSPRESPQLRLAQSNQGSSTSLNAEIPETNLNRTIDSASLSNLTGGLNIPNLSQSQMSRSLDFSNSSDNTSSNQTLPFLKLKTNPLVREILDRNYEGDESFDQANQDVDSLVLEIDATLGNVRPLSKPQPEQFKFFKESLVFESRQFVTDSKLLVSSTTQTREKLVENVNSSMHTLTKIVNYAQATVNVMTNAQHIELLGQRIREVMEAYRATLNAADMAVGKTMSDPGMKVLMRQATSLAGVLSSLMKSLKGLDDR
ncbi:uncharacterized protein LOC135493223 isoform X2 [Lineus longissimus]|uniref:uncharacterized protein LOC135493223 isoform X2 n=1 Tax=Lineus longissimus TaxID=88925 RepID=UPI00315C9A93